jgi:NAD(P)-dependent dehydrogenase (short-subunit alcohol dehydrogenase family)
MTQDLFDLTGRVAIVTGATKGIGRAVAEGLAEAGASVVVSSRKQDLCDTVAAEIAAATGRDVRGMACHVGDWDAIPAFVGRVHDAFGRIDILVNNAGISPGFRNFLDVDLEFWRKIFAVNVEGPLRMSQQVVPIMRDNGGGAIVNVSSMGGYSGGGAGNGAYGATKAALLAITKNMAREWAPFGVRVNAISPGPIRSEMTEGAERAAPGFYERAGNATMLKRVAEAREAIGPVLYLVSDASSYITGEDHCVSGGMLRS